MKPTQPVFGVVREQFRASGSSHDSVPHIFRSSSLSPSRCPHAAAQQIRGHAVHLLVQQPGREHLRFSNPTHNEAIALGSPSRKMALAEHQPDDVLHAPFGYPKWSVISSPAIPLPTLISLPQTPNHDPGVMPVHLLVQQPGREHLPFLQPNPQRGHSTWFTKSKNGISRSINQMMYSMLRFGYPKWSVISSPAIPLPTLISLPQTPNHAEDEAIQRRLRRSSWRVPCIGIAS
ncbi:hypothetical protein Bca52824_054390 [Brassica carinata]|uniref:Uncharacterized protein n=1 Tax=Brassica carinata TaxID=52824 RepID=A0A8X7UKG4_BRACI|nr:hypothetical protein Bca52824_054390 [Brassica carinata]